MQVTCTYKPTFYKIKCKNDMAETGLAMTRSARQQLRFCKAIILLIMCNYLVNRFLHSSSNFLVQSIVLLPPSTSLP